MTKTISTLLAAAAMVAFAASANAGQALTDAQLDSVTAGATAIGTGFGAAGGSIGSATAINVFTAVHGHSAFATGDVASIAASAHHGPQAFAASSLSLGVISP